MKNNENKNVDFSHYYQHLPWMVSGIHPEELDKLYAYACNCFQMDELEKAKKIFYFLTRLDHLHFDYWLSLGLCYQRLTQHQEAIFCFSFSSMIKLSDPRSSLFAGVSYKLLNNRKFSERCFNTAIKLCGQKEEYKSMREYINKLLNS